MSDDDNFIPPSPDAYKPVVQGFEGATVDTADQRYRDAAAAAHAAGITQRQWSALLGIEAKRVASQAKPAAPAATQAAAPAPAAKVDGYEKLSFSAKLALGGHL